MDMQATGNEDRAIAFLLASLITSYPDATFGGNVRTLLGDRALALPEGLRVRLEAAISDVSALDELRSEYIDLFDRGRSTNPVHETEYGRDRALGKPRELADLAGFYHAFGLDLGAEEGAREVQDHVAVELEFYALLLMKQARLEDAADSEGAAVTLDARQKFLGAHLGRFVGSICERPGVLGSAHYSAVFSWCRDLVAQECTRLGVTPEAARWISSESSSSAEPACCGGSLLGGDRERG